MSVRFVNRSQHSRGPRLIIVSTIGGACPAYPARSQRDYAAPPALDRRKHSRRYTRSRVTAGRRAGCDITQNQHVRPAGMLLTTAGAFVPGGRLAIQARLPLRGSQRIVQPTAEAVESRQPVRYRKNGAVSHRPAGGTRSHETTPKVSVTGALRDLLVGG